MSQKTFAQSSLVRCRNSRIGRDDEVAILLRMQHAERIDDVIMLRILADEVLVDPPCLSEFPSIMKHESEFEIRTIHVLVPKGSRA